MVEFLDDLELPVTILRVLEDLLDGNDLRGVLLVRGLVDNPEGPLSDDLEPFELIAFIVESFLVFLQLLLGVAAVDIFGVEQ